MKIGNNLLKVLMPLALFVVLVGCREDVAISPGSNLNVTPPDSLTKLDQWIDENFTTPYNIEIIYRWTESLIDQSRFLHPPYADSVQPALEVVKQLWIDPYNQVADTTFVQSLSPRQIVLVGGVNRNQSNTVTLGLAEAGSRITLFEIDLLRKESRQAINRFIQTIQHEYAHILNQTRPFNEDQYGEISPEGYTAQWFNENIWDSYILGFPSPYARAAEGEDFAEMIAKMLTMSRAEWDATVNAIGKTVKLIPFDPPTTDSVTGKPLGTPVLDADSTSILDDLGVKGRERIRRKERMVVDYYKDEFGIDFYQLQDSVYRATLRLVN